MRCNALMRVPRARVSSSRSPRARLPPARLYVRGRNCFLGATYRKWKPIGSYPRRRRRRRLSARKRRYEHPCVRCENSAREFARRRERLYVLSFFFFFSKSTGKREKREKSGSRRARRERIY